MNLVTLFIFILSILLAPSGAHSAGAPGISSSQSDAESSAVERSIKRDKSLSTERARSNSRQRGDRREKQRARSESESTDISRRAEESSSASRELNLNPGQLVVSVIQSIEAGEGSGPLARAIRYLPVFSQPCVLRARVFGNGAVTEDIDCGQSYAYGNDSGPKWMNYRFRPGQKAGELVRRLVAAYLLRGYLAQAALDDLAESGQVVIPASESPEEVVRRAVFRHLDDTNLGLKAWNESARIVFGSRAGNRTSSRFDPRAGNRTSGCRIPTEGNVLGGEKSWQCGLFRVEDPFSPSVYLSGMELFGSSILGRTYAFRQSLGSTRALARSESERTESTRVARTSQFVAKTSEARASTSASARKSSTSSRSRSDRIESSSQSNISVTGK